MDEDFDFRKFHSLGLLSAISKQAYSIKTTWRNWKMKWDERWINNMKLSWFKVPVKVEQINEYLFSDTVQSQKKKNGSDEISQGQYRGYPSNIVSRVIYYRQASNFHPKVRVIIKRWKFPLHHTACKRWWGLTKQCDGIAVQHDKPLQLA